MRENLKISISVSMCLWVVLSYRDVVDGRQLVATTYTSFVESMLFLLIRNLTQLDDKRKNTSVNTIPTHALYIKTLIVLKKPSPTYVSAS
jgi:hypothetical protein